MRELIAAFDLGTTEVKGVLLDGRGGCVREGGAPLETVFQGEFQEQRPLDWYAAFCEVCRGLLAGADPADVRGVAMSGQMQDLIPVDGALRPCRNAILYSDGRAGEEAEALAGLLGRDAVEGSTGNRFDGSLPFPKLLWLKRHCPDAYAAAKKVLISSKDYVIARLTGECVSDATSCATAGLMDLQSRRWNTAWMDAAGLDASLLPKILPSHGLAGRVTGAAASECGLAPGTPVYAGSGDAGATTLASGIAAAGEYNVNLGTSGWVACVSGGALRREGVFNLAAMPEGAYINVVPFLNAGNVHRWACGLLAPEGADPYAHADRLLEGSAPGSHGALCLPYLAGERFPVMDSAIRGGYWGLTPETGKADLLRAALEGVCYSIRQGIESIGRAPERISVIGGGARSAAWCQILAEVLGHPVLALGDAQYLPAMAVASSVLLAQGGIESYGAFTAAVAAHGAGRLFTPDPAAVRTHDEAYPRWKRLYPALKGVAGRDGEKV